MSSQSTYRQNLQDKLYLESLSPLSRYLVSRPIDIAERISSYDLLFKAIHDICVKLVNKETLRVAGEMNSIVDTHIVQVTASSVVLKFDDIELYDWANGERSHSLCYCHDVQKSPTLKTAILKTLNKSVHRKCVSKLFSEDNVTTHYQFMGFVACRTKDKNFLLEFHPSSYVIFKTDRKGENTVVVCTLTSRHHVLSNMQDRLLQLIQIFQYVHEKINFQLIITNEDVGKDITLDHYSRDAYSIMGFDTESLTQDINNIGLFGIKTDSPIPMMQYGDSYTWAKYGYHILPPDRKRIPSPGVEKHYRTTLIQFLQTDMYKMIYFNLEIHMKSQIFEHVRSIFPDEMLESQRGSYFAEFCATHTKPNRAFFDFLDQKAIEGTVIPLSIFTNLFHQRFQKHRYLESTLELLQQFYISIEEPSVDRHRMFPGEDYKMTLKCTRCHQCVTSQIQEIDELLLSAPTAILRHLHILRTHESSEDDDTDDDLPQYLSLPIMFSSVDAFRASKEAFTSSLDKNDDVLHGPYYCAKFRNAEFKFCEAVKADVSNTNDTQRKMKHHTDTVTHSMSLVKVLFESICPTPHGRLHRSKLNLKEALHLQDSLFNKTRDIDTGYVFREYAGRQYKSEEDMASFDLMESWCLFIHRSLHKTRLAVLSEVAGIVYGLGEPVPNCLLLGFGYIYDEIDIIQKYLEWRKQNIQELPNVFGQQLTYDVHCQGQHFSVISSPQRPFQYQLGQLSSMTSIYDKIGEGWEKINRKKYFRSGDVREDEAKQRVMTTSHQFEENIIILQTLAQIKKISTGKNLRKFRLRCYVKNFERGNDTIRKRHKAIFRDNVNYHFEFPATSEIVQTLPYKFVDELKCSTWTKLPIQWTGYIRDKLSTATDSAIKSIKLVRIIGTDNLLPGNDDVKQPLDNNKRYIYEIYRQKKRVYVNYDQISDIIGDEPWLKSEVHCLCNLASERTIMLTLGAKRKNNQVTLFREGDLVSVSNYGNLFPFAIVHSVNHSNNTARIKWEVSQKIETVEIEHLQIYSLDSTSKRKRKMTEFLNIESAQGTTKDRKTQDIIGPTSLRNEMLNETKFYSAENTSKFCAEGAVKNLLHRMQMTDHDINCFWNLATSTVAIISEVLNDTIPKAVCNSHQQVNSIQKCCWILRQKFKFVTTGKLKLSYFTTVRKTIDIFQKFPFPVLISVNSSNALYDHVVVVWQGIILDYESKFVLSLTDDSLQQICGEHTIFRNVSSGYGLFPPKQVRALCPHVTDWGEGSYHGKDSKIRKYFTKK